MNLKKSSSRLGGSNTAIQDKNLEKKDAKLGGVEEDKPETAAEEKANPFSQAPGRSHQSACKGATTGGGHNIALCLVFFSCIIITIT
jgi:hypothetical protein